MCSHNDLEGYDCGRCAEDMGQEDFELNQPYNPPYKDWMQSNAYRDGWMAAGGSDPDKAFPPQPPNSARSASE